MSTAKCKLRRSPPPGETGTRTRSLSLSSPLRTSPCRSDGPDCPGEWGSLCWWQSPVLIPDPKSNERAGGNTQTLVSKAHFRTVPSNAFVSKKKKTESEKTTYEHYSKLHIFYKYVHTAAKVLQPGTLDFSTPPPSSTPFCFILTLHSGYYPGEITQANAFSNLQKPLSLNQTPCGIIEYLFNLLFNKYLATAICWGLFLVPVIQSR